MLLLVILRGQVHLVFKNQQFEKLTSQGYQSMTRIYKKYDFSYNRFGELPGKVITFSSYPGTIYSVDDFYQVFHHFSNIPDKFIQFYLGNYFFTFFF